MNAKRGLFRLWMVATALYLLLAAFFLFDFDDVSKEFAAAALLDRINASSHETLVPIACESAKGQREAHMA